MNNPETVKSPFDKKTIQHFKKLLLEKRAEAREQMEIVENSIANLNEADDADYSSITHHLGDVGSDVEGEEMNYQLLERLNKYLREIEDALERLENGTYGICMATGKPISKERLEAVPHTRYSIEAKQQGIIEDL